ncbi:hypothetical protein DF19_25110 [Streptomyces olindensis]|nr:hypothetical protein DF19_25110 [Streptomyces olindensis]
MSTETPEQILATADAEITAADRELRDLEARVIADDTEVTPEAIEQARGRRYFAGLRHQAAEKKAAKLRQEQQAAERAAAVAEAQRILSEVTDDDLAAAEAAAGEAMMRLRAVVRARNDAQERARSVLEACAALEPHNPPIGHQRGTPLAAAPQLGYGWRNGSPILWVDGQAMPRLDEDRVMDRARKHPGQADQEQADRQQEAARVRIIERDVALYRADRAAFEQLPAHRRKPALDSLGVDWDAYTEQRERGQLRQAQEV